MLKIFHERTQEEWAQKYLLIQLQKDSSDLKACLKLLAKEEGLVLLCHFATLNASCDATGNWELFGKLTHAERSTLEVVRTLGRATSEQVSQQLGLEPAAASNRLRQLYQMGLVVREEESLSLTGGRRFVYSFVLSFPFQESPVERV
jgi:DNA-binding transcriptional ArsR family regulator